MFPFVPLREITTCTFIWFIKLKQLFVCFFFSIFIYSGGIKFSDLTADEGKAEILLCSIHNAFSITNISGNIYMNFGMEIFLIWFLFAVFLWLKSSYTSV